MTKEQIKAREILIKMKFQKQPLNFEQAKTCALIAVEEILNSNPSYDDYGGNGWIIIDNSEYWKEVKNEINNLQNNETKGL